MSAAAPAAPEAPARVEIRPLPGSFAAEVLGLGLSQPLADEDFRRIHRAHLAAGCPPELRRRLHRTTIEGDKPF